jgi:transposase
MVASPGGVDPLAGAADAARRSSKLPTDKSYDYPRCRRYLAQRGIGVRIARRGIEDSSRLGRVRWVVERTMSWLLNFRRPALRYDRTESTIAIHLTALLSLACALICRRRLAEHRPRSSSRSSRRR